MAVPEVEEGGRAGSAGRPPRSALRSVGLLGGGTVLAALLGLGFQSLLAYWFGAGAETDAWFMSLSIYAFLAKFLMLAHLKSLTLPVYARLRGEDPGRAAALAGGLLRLVVASLSVLVVVLVVGAPLLVDLLAPGYDGPMRDLTVRLVRIRVPALLFLGGATVAMALLESEHRFGVTVSAQKVVPAAVSLAGLLAVADRLGIVAVGWIGLLASVAGSLLVLAVGRGRVASRSLRGAAADPEIREIGRRWAGLGGSNAATFLGEWAFRVGASLLPVGLFSAVLYGRMVHDLLHGAVNDSAQTASLPRFAAVAAPRPGGDEPGSPADGDSRRRGGTDASAPPRPATAVAEERLGTALRGALAALSAVSLPLALFVAATAPWSVALLFGRGRFLEDGMLVPAAASLALFAAGFVLQGLNQLVFAAAFASNRSHLVNRVQMAGHVLRAAALVPLVWAFSYLGLVGAQVGMNAVVLVLLLLAAPRAWRLSPGLPALRAVAASAPAAVAWLLWVRPALPAPLEADTPTRLGVLLAVGVGWAVVHGVAALALGAPGVGDLLGRVRSRGGAVALGLVVGLGAATAAPQPLAARQTPAGAPPAVPATGERQEAPGPPPDARTSRAPLPAEHWAWRVVERLEARGALPPGSAALRPLPAVGVGRWFRLAAAEGGAGERAEARAALERLAEEYDGGWLSGRVEAAVAGEGGGRASGRWSGRAALSRPGGRWAVWGSGVRRGGSGALETIGAGVELGALFLEAGRLRRRLGGGPTGSLVLHDDAALDGVSVSTARSLRVPVLGGVRGTVGVSRLTDYGAVDDPWFGFLRVDALPVPWLRVGLNRGAQFGGRFEGGTVPFDPKAYGPDQGSLSAGDVLKVLVGRATDFDNQVASLDARAALAGLGLPVTVHLEVGWEDADRSWGDPALAAGVVAAPDFPVPLTLRYGYTAFGAPARLCGWCDTLPAFWYRHVRFQDGWVTGREPLGHPLGGYGLEHALEAAAWSPDLAHRGAVEVRRLRRDRWNLFHDSRPGWAWAVAASVRARPAPRWEAAAEVERVSGDDGWADTRWAVALRLILGGLVSDP